MALDSFPNTPHNARVVSLAENEQLWAAAPSGLIGYTGVTPILGDSSGRQVKVRAGVGGRIRGTRFNDALGTTVAVTTNTSGNPRIDLLVARLTRTNYTVSYVVIPGVAAAAPIAPQPVRNDTIDGSGVFDIPLAEIKVANGYTTIASTDVTNRAWWISSSGYQGLDAAKPPVEAGVFFRSNDSGITYIGTSGGSWQKVYYNSGWYQPAAPTGWTAQTLHFARVNDLVVMGVRLIRTGAALAATVSPVIATLPPAYWPDIDWPGVYHCTLPDHSSHVLVHADNGQVVFSGTSGGDGIAQNATILSSMAWPVGEP